MRPSDIPYFADWIAITLRWLVLTGLAIFNPLGLTGLPLMVLLGAGVLWNLGMSGLALVNRRMPAHRLLNIIADIISSLVLFVLGTQAGQPPFWVGLLPLIFASIYYELRGGLLTALIIILGQAGVLALLAMPADTDAWIAAGINLGLNLLAGLVLGLLGHRVTLSVRKAYLKQVGQRKAAEQQVRVSERERIQALYRMTETLSATLNYRVVLDTVLELSVTLLGEPPSSKLVAAVLLFGDEGLVVSAGRGLPRPDEQRVFAAKAGVLPEILRTGEAQLLTDPTEDPELGQLLGLQGCKSALCLPLVRSMSAYGVLVYAHPGAEYFTNERCETLAMVSNQAVIAIQNARLYSQLEQEKERIMETQEETRKQLARSLHDGPTQSVSAIAMRINITRKLLEQNPAEAANELVRIEDLARRTTQEIRHMLFTLRPLALESEGLTAALKLMADKMHDTYQQNVTIDVDESVANQFDLGRQTVIFYLAEEAVNNARKHAQAAEIRVRLHPLAQAPDMALLEVADNGVGFDVQSVMGSYERRGSLGMVNLQERAELVNGRLNIQSAAGKGTRVQIVIPLSEEAADRLRRGKL
ncbi:MAG TPA: GAF domain-containing sensor histidine kinase [Anaerolineaceae bacterium]|nr:GAF domain-containing sensor histidine kinase [Anaerolineaceae bacterium]HQH86484.1 GAF domain-containing sensor histidine kinase [Anaerolineaceae bacterium]